MLVLDTDHMSVLEWGGVRHLARAPDNPTEKPAHSHR